MKRRRLRLPNRCTMRPSGSRQMGSPRSSTLPRRWQKSPRKGLTGHRLVPMPRAMSRQRLFPPTRRVLQTPRARTKRARLPSAAQAKTRRPPSPPMPPLRRVPRASCRTAPSFSVPTMPRHPARTLLPTTSAPRGLRPRPIPTKRSAPLLQPMPRLLRTPCGPSRRRTRRPRCSVAA